MKNSVNYLATLADEQKLNFSSLPLSEDTFTPKGINVYRKYIKKKTEVFLVDDDLLYLKALEASIYSNIPAVKISCFQTGEHCLQQMKRKPAVVILDYHLNSKYSGALDGIEILKKIKKISPETNVIMLSAQDSLIISLDCIDNDAFDYVKKNKTAFERINDIIKNEVEDIEVASFFTKCKYISLILFSTILLYYLTNKI